MRSRVAIVGVGVTRQGEHPGRSAEEMGVEAIGLALADENKENEVISVPGLRGREAKEISVKNLAYIIQARMEEIIEHVYYEIKSSGYENKLIGGIVITGGGAQLKHLVQLVEYITGIDWRVGFPNEHLAKNETLPKNSYDELKSPLYATGIGLLIKGIQAEEELEEMNEDKAERMSIKDIAQSGSKEKGLYKWFRDIIKDGNEIDDASYLGKR